MGTKIQLRRGLKADIPTLDNGEVGFAQDTEELFIGSSSGNKKLTFDATKYASYDAQLAEIAINIKDYFQIPEDDYTEAFKRAISFLQSKGGGKLIVPNGDYLVRADSDLVITSNIEIEGQGQARFYTQQNTGYDHVFTIWDTGKAKNVKITNITFDQLSDTPVNFNVSNPLGFLLWATNFENLIIEKCTFKFWGVWGLVVNSSVHGCEPLIVRDNHFVFKKLGEYLYDASACYLSNGAYQEVTGNVFESLSSDTTYHQMPSGLEIHSYGGKISKNVFRNVNNGINVVPKGDLLDLETGTTPHISITDNIFDKVQRPISLYQNEATPITNVSISNNTANLYSIPNYLETNFVRGYFDYSSPPPAPYNEIIKNIIVEGNQINYFAQNGLILDSVTDRAQNGVFMFSGQAYAENIYIRNNTISNYPFAVLNQYNATAVISKNINFYNNHIIDCGYKEMTGGGNALFSLTNVNGCDIKDNDIKFVNQKTLAIMWIGSNVENLDYSNNRIKSLISNFECEHITYSDLAEFLNCGKIDIPYLRYVNADFSEGKTYYTPDNTIPARQYHRGDVVLCVGSSSATNIGWFANEKYGNYKTYTKNITDNGKWSSAIVDNADGLEVGDTVILQISGGWAFTYITRIDGNVINFDGYNDFSWSGSIVMSPHSGSLVAIPK